MSGVATAIVGSAIIGGVVSSRGASKAASAQEASGMMQLQAARESIESQERMFEQSRADLAPWRQAGGRALTTLEGKVTAGPGDFETSPGYEFRKAEGEKAIERSAAARGGLLSGRTGKELIRYGQDYATQDYDNFLRRYYQSLTPYQSLAGIGLTTASQMASEAGATGRSIGETGTAGAARAGGHYSQAAGQYINQANAITGAMGSGMNNYLMWKYGMGGGFGGTTAPTPSSAATPIGAVPRR